MSNMQPTYLSRHEFHVPQSSVYTQEDNIALINNHSIFNFPCRSCMEEFSTLGARYRAYADDLDLILNIRPLTALRNLAVLRSLPLATEMLLTFEIEKMIRDARIEAGRVQWHLDNYSRIWDDHAANAHDGHEDERARFPRAQRLVDGRVTHVPGADSEREQFRRSQCELVLALHAAEDLYPYTAAAELLSKYDV